MLLHYKASSWCWLTLQVVTASSWLLQCYRCINLLAKSKVTFFFFLIGKARLLDYVIFRNSWNFSLLKTLFPKNPWYISSKCFLRDPWKIVFQTMGFLLPKNVFSKTMGFFFENWFSKIMGVTPLENVFSWIEISYSWK